MKHKWTFIWSAMLCLLIGLGIYSSATSEDKGQASNGTIVFADAGWDSIRVHNQIAGFIIENGYDYNTDVINGSTSATFTGLRNGEIDAYMEIWINNLKKPYNEAKEAGDIVTLGTNFKTDKQGFFVPTYMIEGDPEKGIEPMAPDLKSVKDLAKYAELFEDPADPTKGRIIGGYSGSVAQEIMKQKVKTYGLDENFNYFTPGSAAALSTSIVKAFKNHEPWVGYYWTPTWITSKYDMTMLKEPEYDQEIWNKNYGTAFPVDKIYIAVNSDLPERAPKVVDFLKNYKTSSELTGEALVYMQDNNAEAKDAAEWWLKKHQDLWSKWVPADVARKVKSAL
ncbi:ABC transporter substrate-binding protein [Virgibacillus phasianinus]|uniref:ABC transporter substrate-binding protein n=1 Tax=Virgibacillus phasianinus TaxID=2017483 RepID=A0A220U810_9BACI|nr:ABC transporter substrate-binding protein [Virgibacillus phasianinus]ASK64001.1 ABC transporter substrate-binding protein [Virgibacillus phasianinus]